MAPTQAVQPLGVKAHDKREAALPGRPHGGRHAQGLVHAVIQVPTLHLGKCRVAQAQQYEATQSCRAVMGVNLMAQCIYAGQGTMYMFRRGNTIQA